MVEVQALESGCRHKPRDELLGDVDIDQFAKLAVPSDPLQPIAACAPRSEHQMKRTVFLATSGREIPNVLLDAATHVMGDVQYSRRVRQAQQLHIATDTGIQCGILCNPSLDDVRKIGIAIIDHLLGFDFQSI